MADPEIATDEASIWAALQIDMTPIWEESPQDRAFLRQLIVDAEDRIERFCGFALLDLDTIPPNLAAAVRLDVATHYFSRLNPVLPDAWSELIAPHRRFGFGGAISEESAT